MEVLYFAWKSAWESYEISDYTFWVTIVAVALGMYLDRQKTILGVWSIVYGWTMYIAISGEYFDMQEGMNIIPVCIYGLVGFFVLGFFIYNYFKS